jgi:hypothetical protein
MNKPTNINTRHFLKLKIFPQVPQTCRNPQKFPFNSKFILSITTVLLIPLVNIALRKHSKLTTRLPHFILLLTVSFILKNQIPKKPVNVFLIGCYRSHLKKHQKHKVDARLSLPTKELVALSILFLLLHFDSS